MTVADNYAPVIYTGNGVTTNFPFSFVVKDEDHLKVYEIVIATGEETLIAAANYTVNGVPGSGSVDYTPSGSPLAATKKLKLMREVPITQELDIENQGGFFANTLEDQLDLMVMQTQQLKTGVDRAWKSADNVAGKLIEVINEDHFWIADADGNMVDGGTAGDISSAQTYAEQALAAQGAAEDARDEAVTAAASANNRVAIAADRTALLAVDGAVTPLVALREDGRAGLFKWDGSDLSGTLLGSNITSSAVDSSTETITSANHDLLTGMAVIVTTAVNGLSTNTLYYAIVSKCWTIHYNTQTANFTVGQTLTGGTSGATATIVKQDDDGTTGILWLESLSGTFEQGETITDGAGGSATADNTTNIVFHPDKFKLASSHANALAGTAVNLTGTSVITIRQHRDPQQGIYITPTTAISGASGAWCRSDRFVRARSITEFGVLATNTGAANAQAFQGALDSGYALSMPGGMFEIAGKLYSRPLTLIGSGRGVTFLYFKDTAASAGFEIYYTSDRTERCVIADFTMLTNDTATTTQAFRIDGTDRLVGTANNGVMDMGTMERVEITGLTAPSSAGWLSGVLLHEIINFMVFDCSFNGYFSGSEANIISTFGFRTTSSTNGAGSVVEFHFCRVYYALIAGDADTVEGTIFTNCTFVAVERGIRGIKTHTKVAPYFGVVRCHINARLRAIEINKWQQLDIRGNSIYQRPQASAAGGGIFIKGCREGTIADNTITRNGGTGQDFYGVIVSQDDDAVENSINIQVHDNLFRDTTVGVWLQLGATYTGVYKNKLRIIVNAAAELYLDTSSDTTNWFGSPVYSETNAALISAAASTPTDLCSIALTRIERLQRFDVYVQVRHTKGATDGLSHFFVYKSAGTAVVNFGHSGAEIRSSLYVPATNALSLAFAGTVEVTSVGASNTLTLTLAVNSFGSGADIDAGNANLILVERD